MRTPPTEHDNRKLFVGGLPTDGKFLQRGFVTDALESSIGNLQFFFAIMHFEWLTTSRLLWLDSAPCLHTFSCINILHHASYISYINVSFGSWLPRVLPAIW